MASETAAPNGGSAGPSSSRPLSQEWILARFSLYARVCLLAALFLSPVVLDEGARDPFMLAKITVLWCLGVCALGLWVMWSAERRAWLPRARLGLAAVAFLAAAGLATATSQSPRLSLLGLHQRYGGLLPLLLYTSVMVCVLGLYWERPERLSEVAWAWVMASCALAGYVCLQAAGLDWVTWTDPASGEAFEFPIGTMGNSNFAGAWLGMALPATIYVTVVARRQWQRAMLATLLCLQLLALWYTQTRGGMIAAAAGLAAMGYMHRDHLPRWATRAAVFAVALFTAVLVLVLWHPGSDRPPGPLAKIEALRTNTVDDRRYSWTTAWRIFLDHPVKGTGLDTYYANYPPHRLKADGAQLGLQVTDKPHNIYLEYASNAGILGVGAYLALVGLAVRYGIRRARQIEGPARLLVSSFVAVLVAYLAQAMFSIDVPPLAVMGWVALGAIAVLADPGVLAARERRALPPVEEENAEPGPVETVPGGTPSGARRSHRPRWAVHAIVAVAVIALVNVGLRPLHADVASRSGRLGKAMALHPLESGYPAQAGDFEQLLAQAAPGVAEKAGRLDRARSHYLRALRLKPRTIDYMTNLASVETTWSRSIDPARFADAERWWKRALAHDPTNVALAEVHDDIVAAQRRFVARLTAEANGRPDQALGWVAVGKGHLGLGETRRAAAAFRRALSLEPGNTEALALLDRSLDGPPRGPAAEAKAERNSAKLYIDFE